MFPVLSESCVLQGQQQLAHVNHGLTYTPEGALHTLTQSKRSPAMPEAVSALLTLPGHHTWKLSSTGLLLLWSEDRGFQGPSDSFTTVGPGCLSGSLWASKD